ncbi:hypothetical protein [Dendronalium sp. ChiSLP03b]|uniref:hypothetical protein n=1 Tax=Dendronalium sp. ChiSLP03b TaxID=3075381 RepID=UPI002AD57097|nr:hypothetical protein [Dendronalium sp. ChiSLP03b]MDZ8209327.1 hypothetical protein [Dendronalium sp. ChiSLP03b]
MKISHQSKGQMEVVSDIEWVKATGIISTMISRRLIAFTAITVLSTLSDVSPANAQNSFRVSIPASACAPANPNSQSLVRIVNGAYTFAGNSTGQVEFYCPLPLDTDMIPRVPQNSGHNATVYYRDTDGTGSSAFILSLLQRRDVNGVQNVSNEFTSNSRAVTSNTFGCMNFVHNFSSSNLYFFRVTMRRSNTNQDPAFSGIVFNDACT